MPVIRGRLRSFGRQLGPYLLSTEQNEWTEILEVDGDHKATAHDLKSALIDYTLNEKLTRSKQGIYHCSINPSPEDAARLSKDDWLEMANIHAAHLGFSDQRRVCVLQKCKASQRIHLHIAYDRYDHEKGKMIPIAHNYRKQSKASQEMIQRFNLKPMDERNKKRPAIKETLTKVWQETSDATSFIKQAKARGYTISKGYDKTPYMVVDEDGRSHKLYSHLKGIKRKEVRERLKDAVLMEEKEAIASVHKQQAIVKEKQQTPEQPTAEQEFLEQLKKMRERQQQQGPRMR